MNNLMEYRGYHAKIEYSAEDRTFVGRVLGINDVLAFDGESPDELETMFHESVDDYLEMCAELKREPDKEYKGTFNVRLSPELHKKAVLESEVRGMSLNQFVVNSIDNELNGLHNCEKETVTIIMPSESIKGYIPIERSKEYPLAIFSGEEALEQCKKTTTKFSLSAL